MAWRDPWENVDRSNALRMQSDAQGINMLSALQGAQTNALQQRQMRTAMDDEMAVREAYKMSAGDPAKLREALTGRGAYKQIQSLDKAELDKRGAMAKIGKDEAETQAKQAAMFRDNVAQVADQAGWDALRASMGERGARLPAQFDPRVQMFLARKADDLVKQMTPEFAQVGGAMVDKNSFTNPGIGNYQITPTIGEKETGRHNQVTEGISRGQLDVSRGNLGVAQGNLGVSRERLALEQNNPQYMETSAGLIALPKRLGAGQAPVGVPVMGPDNQPLTKPLKDIPSSVVSGMQENNRSLTKINTALAAITGDPNKTLPKDFIADKSATGFKGYLPNGALARMDPKGVDTRALIADIGSLKIHDRSGAAVTASESPRLLPFIPLASDDPATVVKKLNNFKREYSQMQQEMGDYYSAANGFKPYKPASTGGATDGWKDL